MKDKKWIIDKWTKEQNGTNVYDPMYHLMNEFIADVNQLDEPEDLSLEWISDNAVVGQYPDGMGYVVPAYKLQNLLVPKQEKEQKYRVIFPSVDKYGKGFNYLAKDCYHKELWVEDSRTDGLAWEERSSFTEDEIRDLDKGDILFEHFAVPVEELEG